MVPYDERKEIFTSRPRGGWACGRERTQVAELMMADLLVVIV